jgi:hypothetical protein
MRSWVRAVRSRTFVDDIKGAMDMNKNEKQASKTSQAQAQACKKYHATHRDEPAYRERKRMQNQEYRERKGEAFRTYSREWQRLYRLRVKSAKAQGSLESVESSLS